MYCVVGDAAKPGVLVEQQVREREVDGRNCLV